MSRYIHFSTKGFLPWASRWLLAGLLLAVAIPLPAQDRVTYYHTDHAGSPVSATGADGEVLWRESYAPYGSRLIRQAPENEVWFTGKGEDADLGLHYFGARWYDAQLGRFISVDPAGFDEDNVQLFNRYAYANNNPYGYVDPDGESPLDVAFLAYDIGKLGFRALTGGDVRGAAVDVGLSAAGVLIPVPGAGQMMKAARTGNQARQGAAGVKALPPPSGVPNAGGRIVSDVTTVDQTFFRVSSSANGTGSFLTRVPPANRRQAIEGLALPPGNTAEFIQQVTVPAGTRLQRSRALPAFDRRGGREQFELLDSIPSESFGAGVPFR